MTALAEIPAAGPAVAIRPIRPGDVTALAAMFGRCSPPTRHHRFHAPVTAIPAAYLRRCLDGGPDGQRASVAEPLTGPPGVVALASAGPVPGAPGVYEVGLLVEDAWQRQGVGRALYAGILAGARREGADRIRLQLCRVRPSLIAYVFEHARVVASESAGCDVTLDVAVPAGTGLTRPRRPAGGTAR